MANASRSPILLCPAASGKKASLRCWTSDSGTVVPGEETIGSHTASQMPESMMHPLMTETPGRGGFPVSSGVDGPCQTPYVKYSFTITRFS
jgi:uncharacterized protein YgiB involved in biofilm formation